MFLLGIYKVKLHHISIVNNLRMKNSRKFAQVIIFFAVLIVGYAAEIKDKRQVNTEVAAEEEDRVPSETGFAEAVHSGSKYYQDIYVARLLPDEIEFGHVRENDNEWEQRFEKMNLNNRSRQGKVRWGDKHGGYGEHYWDYNHAGHDHDGDGEESKKQEEYANYAENEQIPSVTTSRQRRDLLNGDVEFIDDRALSLVEKGDAAKHGGNYKRDPSVVRKTKRQDVYKPTFGIKAESSEYQPRQIVEDTVRFFTDFN
ncbi:hypothetical protein RI129_009716 [Pyrocoelia pectoralis]|uniref:Uncharacterized protein n=1 Tax=Pyrocoelia pectoralis TaxID=417401 RepID=A0AAN7V7W5_9COLE